MSDDAGKAPWVGVRKLGMEHLVKTIPTFVRKYLDSKFKDEEGQPLRRVMESLISEYLHDTDLRPRIEVDIGSDEVDFRQGEKVWHLAMKLNSDQGDDSIVVGRMFHVPKAVGRRGETVARQSQSGVLLMLTKVFDLVEQEKERLITRAELGDLIDGDGSADKVWEDVFG